MGVAEPDADLTMGWCCATAPQEPVTRPLQAKEPAQAVRRTFPACSCAGRRHQLDRILPSVLWFPIMRLLNSQAAWTAGCLLAMILASSSSAQDQAAEPAASEDSAGRMTRELERIGSGDRARFEREQERAEREPEREQLRMESEQTRVEREQSRFEREQSRVEAERERNSNQIRLEREQARIERERARVEREKERARRERY